MANFSTEYHRLDLWVRTWPQFLASVQTMEIVPSFAVGSAVGLRGFMSYIFGATLGSSLFGVMVDQMRRLLYSVLLPLSSWRIGTGTLKTTASGST